MQRAGYVERKEPDEYVGSLGETKEKGVTVISPEQSPLRGKGKKDLVKNRGGSNTSRGVRQTEFTRFQPVNANPA